MCGIVAYIGHKPAKPILLEGLKRLEYRGYDSAGMAVLNHQLRVVKTVGRVRVPLVQGQPPAGRRPARSRGGREGQEAQGGGRGGGGGLPASQG